MRSGRATRPNISFSLSVIDHLGLLWTYSLRLFLGLLALVSRTPTTHAPSLSHFIIVISLPHSLSLISHPTFPYPFPGLSHCLYRTGPPQQNRPSHRIQGLRSRPKYYLNSWKPVGRRTIRRHLHPTLRYIVHDTISPRRSLVCQPVPFHPIPSESPIHLAFVIILSSWDSSTLPLDCHRPSHSHF